MNPSISRSASILAAATLLTLINCVKPLYIDDAVYYRYAAQIAQHPFDPYGFEVYWSESPEPAMHVLVPPLVPYWLAAGIRLFGDRPFLWKLWLFPFCLIFAYSLYALFHRFCRGLETPLVWMTVLSAVFLPSLNLMLDIPALALSLLALNVFFRATDRGSIALAALAGMVAGLAILTKYTALVAPAVLVLYAGMFRKTHRGLLAASVALSAFLAWELLLVLRYGESHFLYHLAIHGPWSLHKKIPRMSLPLVGILGGVAPGITLLGLAALGSSRRAVWFAAVLVVLGYSLLAAVPGQYAQFFLDSSTGKARLTLNNLIVGAMGVGGCVTLAAVIRRLCRVPRARPFRLNRLQARRNDWFLVLWLGLEVVGYLVLSPYPAVRRVMGVVVAGTVLAGRLASRSCRSQDRRPVVRGVVIGSMLLGMGYYGVDFLDALAEKKIVDTSAQLIRERDPHPTIWYVVGLWGFQFYAERAGMKPVIPGRSHLRKGDWLIVPDEPFPKPRIQIDRDWLELVDRAVVDDFLPLATKRGYYGGRTPLEHRDGPRVSATVYRVAADLAAAVPK